MPTTSLLRVEYAFAVLDGRFHDAIALSEESSLRGWDRSDDIARFFLGEPLEEAEIQKAPSGADYILGRNRLVSHLTAGLLDQARRELGAFLAADQGLANEDGLDTDELALTLQAAIALSERTAAEYYLEQLKPFPELVTHRWCGPLCVARLLGDASVMLGDFAEGRWFYQIGLEVCRKIDFRPEIAIIKLGLAEALAHLGGADEAGVREHLAFAVTELESMHMRPALKRVQALQEQLETRTAASATYPDGLTERQVQVLSLIAQGKRDAEIAENLVITVRGASNHVANIFRKINVANRAEAAAYAVRHGLGGGNASPG